MIRRQSTYWEETEARVGLLEAALPGDSDSDDGDCGRGAGYIYRFPDLQKRWDDVDGERGTCSNPPHEGPLLGVGGHDGLGSGGERRVQPLMSPGMTEIASDSHPEASRGVSW